MNSKNTKKNTGSISTGNNVNNMSDNKQQQTPQMGSGDLLILEQAI